MRRRRRVGQKINTATYMTPMGNECTGGAGERGSGGAGLNIFPYFRSKLYLGPLRAERA